MANAKWKRVAEEILAEIEAKGRDKSVRLSVDELHRRGGATNESPAYRNRGSWAAAQRGSTDWHTFRDAGLVLNFEPDRTGVPVEWVTFRLNQTPD
jgi:hypothetical protein